MKKSLLLFLFVCIFNFGFGQNTFNSTCALIPKGVKTITYTIDEGSFGWKETEVEYYSRSGLKIKTDFIYDSLFVKTDSFIYNDQNKIARIETNEPGSHSPYKVSLFSYDINGSCNSILISSHSDLIVDSVIVQTDYLHTRNDYILDKNERIIERRTYRSASKVPVFDSSDYDLFVQHWVNDSIVEIEEHYLNRIEYSTEYYEKCLLQKTDLRDNLNSVVKTYEYEYSEFDDTGNWLRMDIYEVKDEQRERVNVQQKVIQLY